MSNHSACGVSRRSFFYGATALTLAAALPSQARPQGSIKGFRLTPHAGRAALVGAIYPETAVGCFNGTVPGPEIRVRQGDRARVVVQNRLVQETTVHWHGVRLQNAMDGVPHLTQKPIGPGETFVYKFDVPDAGTFWYHPHQRSHEQVGRGLAGALIVEEQDPIRVDRDVVWVLGDWRLLKDASISDDFGNLHDISHAGRIGNTVTVNGRVREAFHVRSGERIRLRLVNAANARIFGLEFQGHRPQVIAIDGQPVSPHQPEGGRVVLGPAMRMDLILDTTARPGERLAVTDTFYKGLKYRLLELAYTDDPPLRDEPLSAPVALAPNPVPEPALARAQHHEITLGGGMMGGMGSAVADGRLMDMREMMRHGLVWAINGVASSGHVTSLWPC